MIELRDPGFNEQRCIARHQLGFYHGIAIAGIYNFSTKDFPELANRPSLVRYFSKALESCVSKHPILATVISGPETDKPKFQLADNLESSKHIQIWDADAIIRNAELAQDRSINKVQFIEKVLERLTNEPFADVRSVPPWRIVIIENPDWRNDTSLELLIAYHYSHSHGGGTSGLTFHRTLLQVLQSTPNLDISTPSQHDDAVFWVSSGRKAISLPPALDAPTPLPISWSFFFRAVVPALLSPLLRLPFLWFSATASKPWTGSKVFFNKEHFRTALHLVSIEDQTLTALLKKCRSKKLKLTGLLDSLLAYSLSAAIANPSISPSLKSLIPIDLQKTINVPPDQIGVLASVWTHTHESAADFEAVIKKARRTTDELAKAASTLQDQPVGLLRFVGNFRSWYEGKIGQARDESYEVSNIMALDPAAATPGTGSLTRSVTIENLFYSQPANVTGPALIFNVVSVKGGALNVGVSWQVGALGLGTDSEDAQEPSEPAERDLVDLLGKNFEEAVNRFLDTE